MRGPLAATVSGPHTENNQVGLRLPNLGGLDLLKLGFFREVGIERGTHAEERDAAEDRRDHHDDGLDVEHRQEEAVVGLVEVVALL